MASVISGSSRLRTRAWQFSVSAWLSTGLAPKLDGFPTVYVASCCDRAPRLPSTRPHIAVTVRVGTTISHRVTLSLVTSSSRGMGCARHCSPEVFLPTWVPSVHTTLSSRTIVGTVLVVSQHFSTMSRVADRPVCVTGGATCTGWTPLHVNVPRAEHVVSVWMFMEMIPFRDLLQKCIRLASNSGLSLMRFCGWLHALRSGGSATHFRRMLLASSHRRSQHHRLSPSHSQRPWPPFFVV